MPPAWTLRQHCRRRPGPQQPGTNPRSAFDDPDRNRPDPQSWAAVEPIADTAAGLFYARLFELDPAIERLFRRTDMDSQRKNLMQTLTVVVKSIDKLEQIVPAVQALGRRHAGYGVRESHYATVGEALLWTLQQGLGEAFTPEVRAAWTTHTGRSRRS